MFDSALTELYERLTGIEKIITASIYEYRDTPATMSLIEPTSIDQLVTVSGVIVKISENIPDVIEMHFRHI